MRTSNQKDKPDILIGIPSYNEADCIAHTVQVIDRGIVRFLSQFSVLIVNMDSGSEDDTRRIFLNTKTITSKFAVSIGNAVRGKGVNVLKLLRLSKKLGAKYVCTIDADISTISEKWIKMITEPLIKNRADFVVPLYTRNRYEGNTTNHFCYPFILAWFGRKVRQPIGGEFGMSKKFVASVLRRNVINSTLKYGIDIFLTIHAIGSGFRIQEMFLGRKIHKPSFEKIIPMFHQVVASAVHTASQYKQSFGEPTFSRKIESKWADEFVKKPNKKKIAFLHQYAFQALSQVAPSNLQKYFGLSQVEMKEILLKKTYLSIERWVMILKGMIDYLTSHSVNTKTADSVASSLSPLFFLRVISYFNELCSSDKKRVERIVVQQAQALLGLVQSSKNGYNDK